MDHPQVTVVVLFMGVSATAFANAWRDLGAAQQACKDHLHEWHGSELENAKIIWTESGPGVWDGEPEHAEDLFTITETEVL